MKSGDTNLAKLDGHAVGLGGGQVHFVDDGHNGQPLLEGQVEVGNCLSLSFPAPGGPPPTPVSCILRERTELVSE